MHTPRSLPNVLKHIWLAVVLLAAAVPAYAANPPAVSHILPDKTAVFASVADAPDMARRFQTTALGRMSQDPQLRPLVNQLYGSAAEFIDGLKDTIGASLPDLLSIPQGEVAFAIVPVEEGPPAMLLFVDTGSKIGVARALLKQLSELAAGDGARQSQEVVSGTTVMKITRRETDADATTAAWFDRDGMIVAGTNADVVKQVLQNWTSRATDTLSANAKFAKIYDRCRREKNEQPQLFFYADPVALFRNQAGQQDLAVNMVLMMATRLGVDGIQAVGGSLAMDCGTLDDVMQIHLLLDNPRNGILEPINMEPGDTTPEPWVPGDAASYMTFHWRLAASYKSIATLYDSIRMSDGAFDALAADRITQWTGVDFVKELLPTLDNRVTYMTWMEHPITPQSQVQLFALKLRDPAPMTKAIDAIAQRYADTFTKTGAAGREFYQMAAPRQRRPPTPQRPGRTEGSAAPDSASGSSTTAWSSPPSRASTSGPPTCSTRPTTPWPRRWTSSSWPARHPAGSARKNRRRCSSIVRKRASDSFTRRSPPRTPATDCARGRRGAGSCGRSTRRWTPTRCPPSRSWKNTSPPAAATLSTTQPACTILPSRCGARPPTVRPDLGGQPTVSATVATQSRMEGHADASSLEMFSDLFAKVERRRRAGLVLGRLLAEEADKAFYRGRQRDLAWEVLRHWADLERKSHLAKKETTLDAAFLHEVFGEVLGYKEATQDPAAYHLQWNFTIPDVGTPDAVWATSAPASRCPRWWSSS